MSILYTTSQALQLPLVMAVVAEAALFLVLKARRQPWARHMLWILVVTFALLVIAIFTPLWLQSL